MTKTGHRNHKSRSPANLSEPQTQTSGQDTTCLPGNLVPIAADQSSVTSAANSLLEHWQSRDDLKQFPSRSQVLVLVRLNSGFFHARRWMLHTRPCSLDSTVHSSCSGALWDHWSYRVERALRDGCLILSQDWQSASLNHTNTASKMTA